MARPAQSTEIDNLLTQLNDALTAEFGDDFDPDVAEPGLRAVATAVVKWQRDREDTKLEIQIFNVDTGFESRTATIS